jgi:hypothetical protein
MTLVLFLGALGTVVHNKNLKLKLRDTVPLTGNYYVPSVISTPRRGTYGTIYMS